MTNMLTQNSIPLAPPGGFRGIGPLGLEGRQAFESDTIFTKFISSAIGLMTIIAIIWFIFVLITGAYGFMTAGGDKNAIEVAKKKIVNGLIGLVVVVLSIFIINLIGSLIGIGQILSFGALLGNITGNVVNQ